jgi:hypothetical protein
MADVRGIYAVGNALVTRLERSYDAYTWPSGDKPACSFQLVGASELSKATALKKGVVFFLYRVQRSQGTRGTADASRVSLLLDLHYLVFPWGDSAQEEAHALAWTIRELAQHPTIGRGDLGDGFAREESVQITLGELSNEDLMRIWDAIDPSYRVSVPYVARVVQLDLEPSQEGAPVVAQMLVVERMPG